MGAALTLEAPHGLLTRFYESSLGLLKHFLHGLTAGDRFVLYFLLTISLILGFALGWRRRGGGGAWNFGTFLNDGEARVSRLLTSRFGPPDYHLMNHVTVRMEDGTTQIDHILVSRYGVFVIETKDFNGWIFAGAQDPRWTQVYFRRKSTFQNPIFQNFRHVCAVREVLDFLAPEAVKSVVVFTGRAEFKTDTPPGVVQYAALADYVEQYKEQIISQNRLQFCVGRLETARLAITRETDVEHLESLARRFGDRTS